MRQASPNGSYAAIVTQYYLDLKGYPHYRLELVSSGKRYELAAPESHDWAMRFADLYWSQDSKYVGFLLVNDYGLPSRIEMAFEAKTRREEPFETLYPAIRQRMEQQWSRFLTSSVDPVELARKPTEALSKAYKQMRE